MTMKMFMLALAVIAGAATVTAASANAPGGAYIQCDGSGSSPIRCTPDGW